MPRDWLKQEHPLYAQRKDEWERSERRLAGGEDILDELAPFEYETPETAPSDSEPAEEQYEQRKRQATYLNFPSQFAETMIGHLMRQAPKPGAGLDFGTLGEVRESPEGAPTRAELVYRNVDGVGIDGSQWDNWWGDVTARAMATGHRWIMCESTEDAPQTQQDEIDGLRPYLVDFSPVSVPMWHIEKGVLEFAIVLVSKPRPAIEKGKFTGLEGEQQIARLLLVRQGYRGLNGNDERDDYSVGGWWLFDRDGNLFEPDTSEPNPEGGDPITKPGSRGTWASTKGRIPMFAYYFKRDKGTPKSPNLSRGGLWEHGQLAVSYMNLSSAADFDAWDAAASIQWLLGVDKKAYEIAVAKIEDGSKVIPLPATKDGSVPAVHDSSAGAVVAEVFTTRLKAKLDELREIASLMRTSTPDASGVSKEAGHAEARGPLLAGMASELEDAQRQAVHLLEMRFGGERVNPTGSVAWPRRFVLTNENDDIARVIDLEVAAGISSPTLDAELILRSVRSSPTLAALPPEILKKAETELRQSAKQKADAAERMRTLSEEMAGGGFGGGGEDQPGGNGGPPVPAGAGAGAE